jgi:hypothetical protein
MPKFIGIKRLWYGDVLTAIPGQSSVATLIGNSTEVLNVHQDTWGYSQDDPSVTDYINELTGRPYFRDTESQGNKTIQFTMGEYDYLTKAALQGGAAVKSDGTETTNPANAVGWKAPETPAMVNKSIIALTRTGTYIIFSNASLIAKGDQQQKAVGLGVTALAMENENPGPALPTATLTAQTAGSAISGTVYLQVESTTANAVRCSTPAGEEVWLNNTAATGTAVAGKNYFSKDTVNTTNLRIADEYWFDVPSA